MKKLPAIFQLLLIFALSLLFVGCDKAEEVPSSDDSFQGMEKNMLIMKVDYQSFQYEGYTTLDVGETDNAADTIPFVSTYAPPGDVGYVKLFYENPDNLLFYGGIIWMGCGRLFFPTSFEELSPLSAGLRYPGDDRIGFIDESGVQQSLPWNEGVVDGEKLQSVWNAISKQPEFQYFYSKTRRKVAMFLYTPSVGFGNPADWDYIVFVQKDE